MDSLKTYQNIREHIFAIVTIALILCGLFGNTVSFVIMFRRRKEHPMLAQYLCSIAIFDFMYILGLPLLENTLRDVFPTFGLPSIYFYGLSTFICKMRYIIESSFSASGWVIMTFSIERAIAIKNPFLAKKVYTSRFRSCTIAGCVIVAFIIGGIKSSNRFPYRLIGNNYWTCSPITGAGLSAIFGLTFEIFENIMRTYLPVSVIIVCNVIIVSAISSKKSELQTSMSDSELENNRKIRQNLLLVSIFYCLFTLPYSSFWVYSNYCRYMFKTNKPVYCVIPHVDIYPFITLLVNLNFSTNFIIYTSTLKFFRQDFVDILNGLRCKMKR